MSSSARIASVTTTHGNTAVAERAEVGVLDTCTYIDIDSIASADLPATAEITTVTLAELHQGVAMAKTASARAARTERLGMAIARFDPLPFDDRAAARYGTLASLTVAANRDPRPRRLDLMIAAVASVQELPLYTRNAADFEHLDDAVEVVAV